MNYKTSLYLAIFFSIKLTITTCFAIKKIGNLKNENPNFNYKTYVNFNETITDIKTRYLSSIPIFTMFKNRNKNLKPSPPITPEMVSFLFI